VFFRSAGTLAMGILRTIDGRQHRTTLSRLIIGAPSVLDLRDFPGLVPATPVGGKPFRGFRFPEILIQQRSLVPESFRGGCSFGAEHTCDLSRCWPRPCKNWRGTSIANGDLVMLIYPLKDHRGDPALMSRTR